MKKYFYRRQKSLKLPFTNRYLDLFRLILVVHKVIHLWKCVCLYESAQVLAKLDSTPTFWSRFNFQSNYSPHHLLSVKSLHEFLLQPSSYYLSFWTSRKDMILPVFVGGSVVCCILVNKQLTILFYIFDVIRTLQHIEVIHKNQNISQIVGANLCNFVNFFL